MGNAGLKVWAAWARAPGAPTATSPTATAPITNVALVAVRAETAGHPGRSTTEARTIATTPPPANATIPQAGAGVRPTITASWGRHAIAVAPSAGTTRRTWRAGSAMVRTTTLPTVSAPTSGWMRVAPVSVAASSQSGRGAGRSASPAARTVLRPPSSRAPSERAIRASAKAARGTATTLSRTSGRRTKVNDSGNAMSAQKAASGPNAAEASRRIATADRATSEAVNAATVRAAGWAVRVESVPISAE